MGLSVVAISLAATALQVAVAPGGSLSHGVARETGLVAAEHSASAADDAASSSPAGSAAALPEGVSAGCGPCPADSGATTTTTAAPAPVTLRLPSLGIDSPLVRLGVNGDGTLEVPTDAARAGWFDRGPAPGAVGPAVVAGHVDSHSGPGVFAKLASVAVGAEIDVDREDGSTVRFVVTGVRQVAKDAFPTDDVYGPVAGPELRLLTCGGVFDESTGHYVDNVVVFAREV